MTRVRSRASWVCEIATRILYRLSPALDLLEALPACVAPAASLGDEGAGDCDSGSAPVAVLLASPGDLRHVLRTLAQRRFGDCRETKMTRPLHFYVHEASVEAVARHLLLFRTQRPVSIEQFGRWVCEST